MAQSAVVLPLSAATKRSLESRVEDLSNFDFGSTDLLDLAHTLGSRRTNFSERGFSVVPRGEDISKSFAARPFISASEPHISGGEIARNVFIFTGQGSQWAGMGRELFAEFPIFRNAMADMTSVLQNAIPHGPTWSLQDVILDTSDPDAINDPRISQPCCTAIQVALVQLLASWGIRPGVTAGHSSGEIAAGFAAGHLSAAEAIVIAYYRGFCVANNERRGSMMAAGLSASDAEEAISAAGLKGQLRVACVNSPEGVTISGDADAIDTLLGKLQEKKTFARKLKTGGQAYHSHHMLAFGDEYEALLDEVLPTLGPSIRCDGTGVLMVSSVTGDIKTSDFSGKYWRKNLENPVLFAHAIERIHELGEGKNFFIELGPHSSLELPIKQTLAKAGVEGSQVKYAAPIKRGANNNAVETALAVPGMLWLSGYPVEWTKVNGLQAGWKSSKQPWRVVTDLPRYPFHYESELWSESRQSLEFRQRKYLRHELLGSLVPGGSGREHTWRNILKHDDAAWLGDHRLEETIVFPGAGYLCMAMEALMQATRIDRTLPLSFRLSKVDIMNALTLGTEPSSRAEIFTSLRQVDITNVKTSSIWWDFTISTYQGTTAVTHAKGSIAVAQEEAILEKKFEAPEGTLESTAKRTWYNQFIKSGLNYGPNFQPISEYLTPRMKSSSSPYASAKAVLQTTAGSDPLSVYPLHPATLDAMIQLCIVTTANGVPKDMRAQVPVKFDSITLNTAGTTRHAGEECRLNATSRKVGFGLARGGAEVVAQGGRVVAQFEGLRLAVFQSGGAAAQDEDNKRHPILRTLWKPDVYGLGLIPSAALEGYAQRFADEASSPVKDDGLLKLGAVLDLLVHKQPRGRVLEVGNAAHEFTLAVLDLLASQQEFKKLVSYHTADFHAEANDELSGGAVDLKTGQRAEEKSDLESGFFGLVMFPSLKSWTETRAKSVSKTLAKHGVVVGLATDVSADAIAASGFRCVSFPVYEGKGTIFVAQRNADVGSVTESAKTPGYVIVERDEETPLGSALAAQLGGAKAVRVRMQDLAAKYIPQGSTVFSLCETESPLLATTTDEEMTGVKLMTDRAGTLVWVTGGNKLLGDVPETALVAGMSRAITLEQPSLKFYTYDVDRPQHDTQFTAARLIATLAQQSRVPDREFVQRDGTVHVSRFVPDDRLNAKFRAKQGLEVVSMSLAEAGNARLDIRQPGQFDSLFFRQLEEPVPATLAPDEVRIKVASVGMNAKDYYVLAGRVDTPDATCQLECAGTVEQVGSTVMGFKAGDRVVVMAPTQFQTYQTVPSWACRKLLDSESFDVCATLPLVFATAIYALNHRARLQKGESVLVHSGAGGLGIATIQLAKIAGARVSSFSIVMKGRKRRK